MAAILITFSTAVADFWAAILRGPGDFFRALVLSVDLTAARGVFIAYFAILIVWIVTIPKSEMIIENRETGKFTNLRPFAIVALVSQIFIYLIF